MGWLAVSACAFDDFQPPAPPIIVSAPSDGLDTTEPFLSFEWEPVAGAEQYQLLIDNEIARTTHETSLSMSFPAQAVERCWQLVTEVDGVQTFSEARCFRIQEPERCLDESLDLNWPASDEAESYTVRVIHETSGNMATYQSDEAKLSLRTGPVSGRFIWRVSYRDRQDADRLIGEGSFYVHDRLDIASLELGARETAQSPFKFAWEAPDGPYYLELVEGSCFAPGHPVEGWPRVSNEQHIEINFPISESSQRFAFRVRAVAAACPGPAACYDFVTAFCDQNPPESLTWHDVTPPGFLTTYNEPAIAYDPAIAGFLVLSRENAQILRVDKGLELEHAVLDLEEPIALPSAASVENSLIYDSSAERLMLVHASAWDGSVFSIDLVAQEPWQPFLPDADDVPVINGHHSAIFDSTDNRIIIIDRESSSTVWELDLNVSDLAWQPMLTSGAPPVGPYSRSSAWYEENRHWLMLYLAADLDENDNVITEVRALDLETSRWRVLEPSGLMPAPRYEFGSASFGCHYLVTHGRRSSFQNAGDTFLLWNQEQWIRPRVEGDVPDPDWGFDIAWDPIRRVMLVVGGAPNSPHQSRVSMITGF